MSNNEESILENLIAGRSDTVRVYRTTSYVTSQGDVRHHYDVCTGYRVHADGTLDCELGKIPADRWEPHIFGDGYKYFN